jgi:hypothetical protein
MRIRNTSSFNKTKLWFKNKMFSIFGELLAIL